MRSHKWGLGRWGVRRPYHYLRGGREVIFDGPSAKKSVFQNKDEKYKREKNMKTIMKLSKKRKIWTTTKEKIATVKETIMNLILKE